MSPHVQPRALGWSVAALVAAITTGGAAIPVAVPSYGETIELQANLFGVGADYFDQDMHQFRCHVTPTNTSLEPFFTACSRQQAHDFSGDTPVMLTMRTNPASEAGNIDVQLAAAQAELNIEVPPTMLTKAVGGGDRRQRRAVPDGDRTQLVVRIQCEHPASNCDPCCDTQPVVPAPPCTPAVTLTRLTQHHLAHRHIQPRSNRQRRRAVILRRGLRPRDDQIPRMAVPKVVVFDLDNCVWWPEMYMVCQTQHAWPGPCPRLPP
jgi:hypothetical protein